MTRPADALSAASAGGGVRSPPHAFPHLGELRQVVSDFEMPPPRFRARVDGMTTLRHSEADAAAWHNHLLGRDLQSSSAVSPLGPPAPPPPTMTRGRGSCRRGGREAQCLPGWDSLNVAGAVRDALPWRDCDERGPTGAGHARQPAPKLREEDHLLAQRNGIQCAPRLFLGLLSANEYGRTQSRRRRLS
jgi:hypothetical protein